MEKNYDDIKNKLLLRAEQERLERNVMLIDHWNNLKPFKTPNDVPNIPVVDHTKYHEFFVPRLIAAGAIPKTELIDNQVYIGEHRRCNVAIWDAKKMSSNIIGINLDRFLSTNVIILKMTMGSLYLFQ